ncbi:MAG: hypothetical protein ACFFBD_21670, partial [Candidatus Hodarchaeota archaeon]
KAGDSDLEMLFQFIKVHGTLALERPSFTTEDILSKQVIEDKLSDQVAITTDIEADSEEHIDFAPQIESKALGSEATPLSPVVETEISEETKKGLLIEESDSTEALIQPPPPPEEIPLAEPESSPETAKKRHVMNIELALSGFSRLFPQIQLIGIYDMDSTPVLFGKENEVLSKDIQATIQSYSDTLSKMVTETGNPSSFETAKHVVYFNVLEIPKVGAKILAVVAQKGVSPLEIAPEDINRLTKAVMRLMS